MNALVNSQELPAADIGHFPGYFVSRISFFMEFDIGAEHARLLRLTLPRFSFSPEIDISAEHVRLRRSTLPLYFFPLFFPRVRHWFRACAFYSVLRVRFGSSIYFFIYFLLSNSRYRPRAYSCMSFNLFFWNASGPEYARGGMSI